MSSRSIYMPQSMWNEVDAIGEKEDLSANQVIRRVLGWWFMGLLELKEEEMEDARPVRKAKIGAPKAIPTKTKTRAQKELR